MLLSGTVYTLHIQAMNDLKHMSVRSLDSLMRVMYLKILVIVHMWSHLDHRTAGWLYLTCVVTVLGDGK